MNEYIITAGGIVVVSSFLTSLVVREIRAFYIIGGLGFIIILIGFSM